MNEALKGGLKKATNQFDKTIKTLNKVIKLGEEHVALLNTEITYAQAQREEAQASIKQAEAMKENINKLMGVNED